MNNKKTITKDILFLQVDDIRFLFDVEFTKYDDYYEANSKKFGFRIESIENSLDLVKEEFAFELKNYIKALNNKGLLISDLKAKGFSKDNFDKKIVEIKNTLEENKFINESISKLDFKNIDSNWQSKTTTIR